MRSIVGVMLGLLLAACGAHEDCASEDRGRLTPASDGAYHDAATNALCAPRPTWGPGESRCLPILAPVQVLHARADCAGPGLIAGQGWGDVVEVDGWGLHQVYRPCVGCVRKGRPDLYTWRADGICDRAVRPVIATTEVAPMDLSDYALVPGLCRVRSHGRAVRSPLTGRVASLWPTVQVEALGLLMDVPVTRDITAQCASVGDAVNFGQTVVTVRPWGPAHL